MSVGKIGLLIAVSTGIIIGVVWYIIGGVPQDHDEYGSLRVGFLQQGDAQSGIPDLENIDPANLPDVFNQTQKNLEGKTRSESKTVELPEGEVRLNWEGGVQSVGSSRTADDAPDDLTVVVRPAGGGKPIETEKSGGYSSVVGDTGWSSWRKVEIPEAGPYFIAAVTPSGEAGILAIGKSFWNPLGSRILGALLPLLLALALFFGIKGVAAGLRSKG